MRGTSPKRASCAALAAAATLLAALLPGCSTFDSLKTPDPEKEAREIAPEDPMARPTQVAWTSARASHCGFIFNPAQHRSNFMAAEMQAGNTPEQMQKIEHAYDYTLQSVTATIKNDVRYCSDERAAAIRKDLNRYLAGDYTPSARMAR
jgi:hypothetical protein